MFNNERVMKFQKSAGTWEKNGKVKVTFLGHSCFRITTPEGESNVAVANLLLRAQDDVLKINTEDGSYVGRA